LLRWDLANSLPKLAVSHNPVIRSQLWLNFYWPSHFLLSKVQDL
jgi:hypothetical protein